MGGTVLPPTSVSAKKLSPIRDTLKQIEKVQATKKRDGNTIRPGDKGGANKKTRFSESTKCKQGDGNPKESAQ